MTGMSANDFFDKIYYGDEVELEYLGTTYFIQGFQSNGVFRIVVDYWNNIDGSEPEHDYLLDVSCKTAQERVECFEKAPVFNGKTFWEIEKNIVVLYG